MPTNKRCIIMKNLMDRVMEFDNELIESLEESHPRFINLYLKMYNGKKFGFQFMDESGNVTEEYTINFDNNRMTGYEEGIGEVSMTARCKISLIEDILENYRDGFLNKPLMILPGYMAKSLYAMAKGDVRFGKKE